MDQAKIAELENSVTAAERAAADAGGTDDALNTVVTEAKDALAKAKAPSQGSKYTEKEQAAFSLKKNAERARALGLDPGELLGVKTTIATDDRDEDSKPVTVGMLRDITKAEATKTALQRAEEIADIDTRETVKRILSTNIKPSGDAEADFRLALSAASAEKNKQVLAEISRYSAPKKTAAGGSQGARVEEDFTPTAEEQRMMQPPYNLSREKVISARKRSAEKGQ